MFACLFSPQDRKNCLTFISFPLFAVGSWNTQNPIDGIGSCRVVGGAGYRRRRCAWYWGAKKTEKYLATSLDLHAFTACAVTPYDGPAVTYSVAWRRQGCPIRRWMERLLDFSSDDPGEQWKSRCQLLLPDPRPSELFGRSIYGDTA